MVKTMRMMWDLRRLAICVPNRGRARFHLIRAKRCPPEKKKKEKVGDMSDG